jgi:hypothetical protein
LLARWADERRGRGTFPGPLGRAGGTAGPLGRESVCGAVGHQRSRQALGTTDRSRREVCRPSGRTGVGAVRDVPARTGRRPAQRVSRSPSQGRRPWGLPHHVPSGPTGRPFSETGGATKTNCCPIGGCCVEGTGGGRLFSGVGRWDPRCLTPVPVTSRGEGAWTGGGRCARPSATLWDPYPGRSYQEAGGLGDWIACGLRVD